MHVYMYTQVYIEVYKHVTIYEKINGQIGNYTAE